MADKSKTYLVPAEDANVEIIRQNSRFITTVSRTGTVDEAKAMIESIRQQMPDASHHVYAFRIGHGDSVTEGMSDDGEPSGTSGPPVLAVLRGSEIGDITCVVTRYFGGTKLGTGGLVSAYKDAAKAALAELKVERKVEWLSLHCKIPYAELESFRRLVAKHEGAVDKETFAADVCLDFRIPKEELPEFRSTVRDKFFGNLPEGLDED